MYLFSTYDVFSSYKVVNQTLHPVLSSSALFKCTECTFMLLKDKRFNENLIAFQKSTAEWRLIHHNTLTVVVEVVAVFPL